MELVYKAYQPSQESTAPTTTIEKNLPRQGKYFLFEKLLSFLDTTDELNPVLAGYFSKLMQVLVAHKTKEVFTYIYNNPHVLEWFVRHLY